MDQIGSLLDRPKMYFNVDGVGELAGGFMMLGYGLLLGLQAHSPKDAVWHQMYAFVIYMAVMFSIIHYGTRAIKNQITYPRTGFVEYRKQDTLWPRILAALLASLALVGLMIARRYRWDIAASGSLYGPFFAAGYAWRFARAVRWKWVVACGLALGSFAIAVLPADFLAAVADDSSVTHPVRTRLVGSFLLTLLMYGPMLLISGGISFWLYLRHTHPPTREAE